MHPLTDLYDYLFRREAVEPARDPTGTLGPLGHQRLGDDNPERAPSEPIVDQMALLRQQERDRRTLAHQTIEDMDRLRHAWSNNSILGTKTNVAGAATQPLTVTLNEEQIRVVCAEFNRLAAIVRSVQFTMQDWLNDSPRPDAEGLLSGRVNQVNQPARHP